MNTIGFAWPWLLAALPLPVLVRLLAAPVNAAPALRVPALPSGCADGSAPRDALPLWLAALAWLLLVIAAARPQMPGDAPPQRTSGRDLMLAVDVSMSMATADLQLDGKAASRLQAAQQLAGDFLERRTGDRIGLLVFGSQAYLHTPLTHDARAVRAALAATEPGLAGRDTALGDAIALAVNHLRALPDNRRVLVLLTDGANTAGTLSPERSVWLARRENVRIHVIGVGAATDAENTALSNIGAQTGGLYRRATDSRGMAQIFDEIDRLEPVENGGAAQPPLRELYVWPLAAALALACILALRHSREVAA